MKRYHLLLIAATLIALGGMCYGLKETVSHHYGAFAERFPQADPAWWNPDLSWRNKYEGGDPERGPAFWLSTSALVLVTDAYHLFGDLQLRFTCLGFVALAYGVLDYSKLILRFRPLLLGLALGWLIWSLGFHLIYTLIF
jgi:hypothetical protein